MATAWGLVTTVRAPEAQVLAFLSHHLGLGAARVWVFFDDPDDPAHDRVAALPGVTATRCSPAHWQRVAGRRPDKIENRQSRNAQCAYAACTLPWIGHVDVDELIWPRRPVAAVLDEGAPSTLMVRMEPFEAMHDPARPGALPRLFRGALKARHADLRARVLGPYAALLPEGMLSHSVGKALFRTGIDGLSVRLHGAFQRGKRLPGPPFCSDLALLHCHAQNEADWQSALAFRLTRGAYQYRPELQAYLASADRDEVARFYRETQVLTEEKADLLRAAGRLIEADLGADLGAGPV